MKLSALLMTAAVGVAISGAAIAAETHVTTTTAPNSTTTTTQSTTLNSMPVQSTATVTATSRTTTTQIQAQTVADAAAANSEFSTFSKAVKAAGLESTLSANGPMTIFAPTNAAFDKLGQQKLNDLMKPENKAQLTQILTYHVVPQELPKDLKGKAQPTAFETREGQSLMLRETTNGELLVQNARASNNTQITASNGKIIPIDTVLMPEADSKMSGAPSLVTPAAPKAPQNVARVPSAESPVTQKRAIAPESPLNTMRNQ